MKTCKALLLYLAFASLVPWPAGAQTDWQFTESLSPSDARLTNRFVDFYALYLQDDRSFKVSLRADYPYQFFALVSPSGREYVSEFDSELRVDVGEPGEWRLVVTSLDPETEGSYELLIEDGIDSVEPRDMSESGTALVIDYFRPRDSGGIDREPASIGDAIEVEPSSTNEEPAENGEPSASPEQTSAFWNEWIEELGDPAEQPVEALERGRDYRFRIDLAAVRYSELLVEPAAVSDSPVDEELLETIEEEIAAGRTTLRLNIHIAAIGQNLRIVAPPPRILDIDLTKLSNPPSVDDSATIPSELSAVFSAASIETEVHALAGGCGAVVVFVAASDGVRPLDHLVQRVAIGDAAENCDGEDSFESGLNRILALSGGPEADMGLQVIESELGGQTHTAALLLDKDGNHWAWEMGSTMSGFMADEALFEGAIDRARDNLTSDRPLDYSAAGRQLSEVIFSGRRPDQVAIASNAFAALKRRVDNGPTPSVLIRALDSNDNPLFVPLRLVTAKGAHGQFSGTLHVIHPLPRGENYQRERRCIDDWTFAIPPEVGGSDLPSSIRQDPSWLHASDPTLDILRNYFSTSPSPPEPEGLVLLSHHDSGQIWYDDDGNRLLASSINHQFADGSVAVLLSCATAAARERDMLLTQRLAGLGVDSLIVSPFSLKASYGRAFAIGFAEAVREARAAGNSDTLLELFDAASRKAVDLLNTSHRRNFEGMDLELIVAGDHSQRVCTGPNQ